MSHFLHHATCCAAIIPNYNFKSDQRDELFSAAREGIADTVYQKSWVSSHMSRSCSQQDLVATGGAGLYYCFTQ